MKLDKKTILKIRNISILDADIRVAEFEEHKTINPLKENYDFKKMKELWPEGIYFDKKNLEGVYGNLDGRFVVIFRGADSLLDWLISLLMSKKEVPYKSIGTKKEIKIHTGFYNDYLSIRDFLRTEFKKSGLESAIFHGHSKGAAIASLAALDFKYNYPEKDISGFVEGSPRVGNRAFKKSFNKYLPNFTNFEYGSDLIPQLPLRIFGYEHVGTSIHIGPPRRKFFGTKKDHDWKLSFPSLVEELKEDFLYS